MSVSPEYLPLEQLKQQVELELAKVIQSAFDSIEPIWERMEDEENGTVRPNDLDVLEYSKSAAISIGVDLRQTLGPFDAKLRSMVRQKHTQALELCDRMLAWLVVHGPEVLEAETSGDERMCEFMTLVTDEDGWLAAMDAVLDETSGATDRKRAMRFLEEFDGEDAAA